MHPLNITIITTSSDTRGWTYALDLTHPTVTTNGIDMTKPTISLSNIIWSFEIIQCHTLQHLQHFTHTTPTYAQTFFQNCFPTNDISTYIQLSMHIIPFVPHFLNYKFLQSISLTLKPRVKIFFFMAHASILTNALACFFMLGFNQKSTSALTHVLWYMPFIKNGL